MLLLVKPQRIFSHLALTGWVVLLFFLLFTSAFYSDINAMTALITRQYQDKPFTFREDGYFNMTKAAAQFGKRIDNFLRLDETAEYLEALSKSLGSEVITVDSKRGKFGGSFGHPKLAVFFARWLDVRFAVWCDMQIDDIIRGKADVVTVDEPEPTPIDQAEAERAEEGPVAPAPVGIPTLAPSPARQMPLSVILRAWADAEEKLEKLVSQDAAPVPVLAALPSTSRWMTVCEWVAAQAMWMNKQQKAEMGRWASEWCRINSVRKRTRTITSVSLFHMDDVVGEYPLEALEYAASMSGFKHYKRLAA